jgi:hypothetical protein
MNEIKSVKVLEPFTPEKTVFTKDEFIRFLSLHKEDLSTYSTYKLNKLFSINGYRITKLKGEISLVKIHKIANESSPTPVREVSLAALKILDEKINYVIEVLRDNKMIPEESNDISLG